jgi:hypothetical protein
MFRAEVRGQLTLTDALYATGAVFTETVIHSGALYDKGYWTEDLNDPTSPRRTLNEDPGKWLDHEYIPWKQIKIVRDQLIESVDSLSDVYFKKDGSEPFANTLTLLTDGGTSTIRTPNETGSILQFNVGSAVDGSETTALLVQDGSISAVGNRLINLSDPVYDQDAATMAWVKDYTSNLGGDSGFVFDPDGNKELKGTGGMLFSKQSFIVQNYNDNTFLIMAQGDKVSLSKPEALPNWDPQFDQDLATMKKLNEVKAVADAKVEDVNLDNKQYVRMNQAWQEIDLSNVSGDSGISEAPKTNKVYARDGKIEKWVEAPDSTQVPSSEAVSALPSRPVRGKIYITSGNVVAIGIGNN